MPIAVPCPNCAASVKAPDDTAGRTVTCPKCFGAMAVPSRPAPAPAKPAARLVTARPKPADDEPDEKPRKRRARDDGDEESEDDRPRAKRRERDEADPTRSKRRVRDDDDRPRRRARREDDGDRPRRRNKRKKESNRALLLGLIGGAVVLCGGLFAAVWFGHTQPAAERAKAESDQKEAEVNRKSNEGNAVHKPVPNDRVPEGSKSTEAAPVSPAKPDDKPPPPGEPVLTVAADVLTAEFAKDSTAAAAKYEGKLLKVTGVVSFTDPTKGEVIRFADVTVGPAGKGKKYRTACLFEGDARGDAKKLKHPDRVSIVGRCGGIEKSAKKGDTFTVTLAACRVEK